MTKQERTHDTKARLLDAALTEFVEHGYDGASTAGIAERAGVAKALVFHHFESKDALFLAVAERVLERVRGEYERVMRETPPDLLARVLAWTERKFAMFREDPRELSFLVFTQLSAPKLLRSQVRKRLAEITRDDMQRLVEGMDASRLKVSPQEAIDVIETVALGLEQRLYRMCSTRSVAQIEALSKQARSMLELIAKAVYRKERKSKRRKRRNED